MELSSPLSQSFPQSQLSQSKQFYGPSVVNKIKTSQLEPRQKAALKKLTEALICPKCSFLFEDPCAIDCSHTFCRDCLEDSLIRALQCPTCSIPAVRCDMKSQRDIAQTLDYFRAVITTKSKIWDPSPLNVMSPCVPGFIEKESIIEGDHVASEREEPSFGARELAMEPPSPISLKAAQSQRKEDVAGIICQETQQIDSNYPSSPSWTQNTVQREECSVLPDTQENCFVAATLPDSFLDPPSSPPTNSSQPCLQRSSPTSELPVTQTAVIEMTTTPVLKTEIASAIPDSVSAALDAFFATGVMGTMDTQANETHASTQKSEEEEEEEEEGERCDNIDDCSGELVNRGAEKKNNASTVGSVPATSESATYDGPSIDLSSDHPKSPVISQIASDCPTPTTQQCNDLVEALAAAAGGTTEEVSGEVLSASDSQESEAVFDPYSSEKKIDNEPKNKRSLSGDRFSFTSGSSHISPFQKQRLNSFSPSNSLENNSKKCVSQEVERPRRESSDSSGGQESPTLITLPASSSQVNPPQRPSLGLGAPCHSTSSSASTRWVSGKSEVGKKKTQQSIRSFGSF